MTGPRCWLMGHEYRFRSAVARRIVRAGVNQFRVWHIERCYRCKEERATEQTLSASPAEIHDLFHFKACKDHLGSRFEVWLDGRLMGNIGVLETAGPSNWYAFDFTGAIKAEKVGRQEAAASLW